MGQKVRFAANEQMCEGLLAVPPAGKGPAVVVIQEWWGLVPHVEDLVERLAREGFLALAPDLYHGRSASSPDAARKLMMELEVDHATEEIEGAGEFLLGRPECSSRRYGIVGFCMGGALAQFVATKDETVGAAVSFYGGFQKVRPDWDRLYAPLLLIYGGEDAGVPASQAEPLAARLRELGKEVEVVVYPGAGHAFFNDTRREAYHAEAAADAWKRTLAFFRRSLAG
ncbi:dienelactone hydrolase family protein [Acidobacteria bacterium ACD]|nr:dienelactone hydrolase family protein [Acidobacteria bacterium ACD]